MSELIEFLQKEHKNLQLIFRQFNESPKAPIATVLDKEREEQLRERARLIDTVLRLLPKEKYAADTGEAAENRLRQHLMYEESVQHGYRNELTEIKKHEAAIVAKIDSQDKVVTRLEKVIKQLYGNKEQETT